MATLYTFFFVMVSPSASSILYLVTQFPVTTGEVSIDKRVQRTVHYGVYVWRSHTLWVSFTKV